MTAVEFEIVKDGYTYRDVLYFEDDAEMPSSQKLTAMKYARFNKWLDTVQNPPTAADSADGIDPEVSA